MSSSQAEVEVISPGKEDDYSIRIVTLLPENQIEPSQIKITNVKGSEERNSSVDCEPSPMPGLKRKLHPDNASDVATKLPFLIPERSTDSPITLKTENDAENSNLPLACVSSFTMVNNKDNNFTNQSRAPDIEDWIKDTMESITSNNVEEESSQRDAVLEAAFKHTSQTGILETILEVVTSSAKRQVQLEHKVKEIKKSVYDLQRQMQTVHNAVIDISQHIVETQLKEDASVTIWPEQSIRRSQLMILRHKKLNISDYTNTLMKMVYSPEILRSCSLSGKGCNAHKEKASKPRLPHVDHLINFIVNQTNANPAKVKKIVTWRLNTESKKRQSSS